MAGVFPCFFAFSSAYRPNSSSRVFSGWIVKPYFANRFGMTSITFSASSLYWKHSTASSAKRISCASPLIRGFTSFSNHSSSTKCKYNAECIVTRSCAAVEPPIPIVSWMMC